MTKLIDTIAFNDRDSIFVHDKTINADAIVSIEDRARNGCTVMMADGSTVYVAEETERFKRRVGR